MVYDIEIPVNTRATIYVPSGAEAAVTEGGQALGDVKGLQVKGKEGAYVVVEVGSGIYHFEVPAAD